jgi:hypothetical protein
MEWVAGLAQTLMYSRKGPECEREIIQCPFFNISRFVWKAHKSCIFNPSQKVKSSGIVYLIYILAKCTYCSIYFGTWSLTK